MDKKVIIRIFCAILATILILGLILPYVGAAENDTSFEQDYASTEEFIKDAQKKMKEDQEEFEEKHEKIQNFVDAMFIIIPILMIVLVAVVIVFAIRTSKKNKQAAQQFKPFAAPESNFAPPPDQQEIN